MGIWKVFTDATLGGLMGVRVKKGLRERGLGLGFDHTQLNAAEI
jgi:hypothetical protein